MPFVEVMTFKGGIYSRIGTMRAFSTPSLIVDWSLRLGTKLALASTIFMVSWLTAQVQPTSSRDVTLRGNVVDTQAHSVSQALVQVQSAEARSDTDTAARETVTDIHGDFSFDRLAAGDYLIVAKKADLRSSDVSWHGGDANATSVRLVLHSFEERQTTKGISEKATEAMEFSDQPHFTVAGVTDWTAAGGHGSDVTLRTSESLTSATTALKPAASMFVPGTVAGGTGREEEKQLKSAADRSPRDFDANERLGEFYLSQGQFAEAITPLEKAASVQSDSAPNFHALALAYEGVGQLGKAREAIGHELTIDKKDAAYRLAGTLDEKRGDSLLAVQEFEQAAAMNPSEQNEFALASELLQHRAIWQAEEVFRKAASAYPKSLRLQAGLGAALFAGARYEDAALQFCKASDLDPADTDLYLLLGKIAVASPKAVGCVKPKLARFVLLHPENASANYFYAMAILKAQPNPAAASLEQAKQSLNKAVSLEPKCSEAYLELGVLAAAQHDNTGAIRSYLKAIAADPMLADAHYRLGVAYDRIGESAKAEEEFALHKQIEKQQAEATEKQRKAVKQFLFTKPDDPAVTAIK